MALGARNGRGADGQQWKAATSMANFRAGAGARGNAVQPARAVAGAARSECVAGADDVEEGGEKQCREEERLSEEERLKELLFEEEQRRALVWMHGLQRLLLHSVALALLVILGFSAWTHFVHEVDPWNEQKCWSNISNSPRCRELRAQGTTSATLTYCLLPLITVVSVLSSLLDLKHTCERRGPRDKLVASLCSLSRKLPALALAMHLGCCAGFFLVVVKRGFAIWTLISSAIFCVATAASIVMLRNLRMQVVQYHGHEIANFVDRVALRPLPALALLLLFFISVPLTQANIGLRQLGSAVYASDKWRHGVLPYITSTRPASICSWHLVLSWFSWTYVEGSGMQIALAARSNGRVSGSTAASRLRTEIASRVARVGHFLASADAIYTISFFFINGKDYTSHGPLGSFDGQILTPLQYAFIALWLLIAFALVVINTSDGQRSGRQLLRRLGLRHHLLVTPARTLGS